MHKKQMGIEQPIEPAIGISTENRNESVKLLNALLADEFVLLVQTLNYHWNLVGPEFHDYHKLFDDQYKALFEFVDEIAERARMVGGIALGTMAEFIRTATLKEDNGDIPAPRTMIERLCTSQEAIIRSLREAITKTSEKDAGTNNFLTDLMEKHEKMAWMLRSLLERR